MEIQLGKFLSSSSLNVYIKGKACLILALFFDILPHHLLLAAARGCLG